MPSLPSILGPRGDEALRRQLAEPALVAFDFDGTLAPIVEHPPHARLAPPVDALLRRLAALVPLAIVSGRALDDLRERAPVGAFRLVGNHGNDTAHADPIAVARLQSACREWQRELAPAIEARLGRDAGVEVEDKGVTLSLHYRRAANAGAARRALLEIAEALQPRPRIIGGKLILNLLPPGAQTKFEALQQLAGELGTQHVLFIGDDDTDEVVFERAPPAWLTVRVEPGAHTAARWSLAAQDDVARLIERMLQALAGPGSPASGAASS